MTKQDIVYKDFVLSKLWPREITDDIITSLDHLTERQRKDLKDLKYYLHASWPIHLNLADDDTVESWRKKQEIQFRDLRNDFKDSFLGTLREIEDSIIAVTHFRIGIPSETMEYYNILSTWMMGIRSSFKREMERQILICHNYFITHNDKLPHLPTEKDKKRSLEKTTSHTAKKIQT